MDEEKLDTGVYKFSVFGARVSARLERGERLVWLHHTAERTAERWDAEVGRRPERVRHE